MTECTCKPLIYSDPNQLKFDFILTGMRHSKSYIAGYETGVEWDANWIAGGPYVQKNDIQSQLSYDEWCIGFKEGLADLLKIDSDFAAWWSNNLNKGIRGLRYNKETKSTVE